MNVKKTKFRRILIVAAAVVMVLGMSSVSFAANDTGTIDVYITVERTLVGNADPILEPTKVTVPAGSTNFYELEEGEIFKITPTAPLLWIKVVPIIYDSYKAFIETGEKNTGSPVIFHNRIINVGESIYIRSNTPDTFPKFSVTFQRFDYVEGSFNISSQGRYPGDIATDYTTSPTFLTFLFYLFK